MGYRVINGKLYSIPEIFNNEIANNNQNANSINKKENFDDILKKAVDKDNSFVMSNHAIERLKDRKIVLSEADMSNINNGINEAMKKGAKESLILYKDLVLIASIKNRTIITAMDKTSGQGNVFTNIDSVVII